MIIISGGILLGLLFIASVLIVANKALTPKAQTPQQGGSTPVATQTTATTAQQATTSTSSTSRSGPGWFGKLISLLGKLIALLLVIGIVFGLLALLYKGAVWIKNEVDSWASNHQNHSEEVVVTMRPPSSAVVPLKGHQKWSFDPGTPTYVEYLDLNGTPIRVYCDGRLVSSVLEQHGIDKTVSAYKPNLVRYLRFTPADRNGEPYRFTVTLSQ